MSKKSSKQGKQGTPFQLITDVKTDTKSVKKFQQYFTSKDSSAAVKGLLSMMALPDDIIQKSYYSSHTEQLIHCLKEIPNSIDNLFKKGGHGLTTVEVQSMLKMIKFTSNYLPINDIKTVEQIFNNFLCRDSLIETRKESFKTLLEMMKIHNNVTDFYGKLFLPSLNLRGFIPPNLESSVPESQVPTLLSNSNVYSPADVSDTKTQEANSLTLLDIFFKELFSTQENFKFYSPLFHQLVCCVIPNYQKIPSLSTLNITYHFNSNNVPALLYKKLGEEVMSAARGQFSRLLLSDERFFNILLHMYTEMYTVFTPSNKDCISQFLTLYKDFFFNQQSNLQSVLKDKLTTTQFKIIETPSSWFSQQFLTTQLANTETKSLLELIISFYDKFSQLENELTPSLKSTVLSTITQCSLNFLQYAKDPSYIPYKRIIEYLIYFAY
ncbi:hypothetical protein QTN25_008403 [Entamoeba marina]